MYTRIIALFASSLLLYLARARPLIKLSSSRSPQGTVSTRLRCQRRALLSASSHVRSRGRGLVSGSAPTPAYKPWRISRESSFFRANCFCHSSRLEREECLRSSGGGGCASAEALGVRGGVGSGCAGADSCDARSGDGSVLSTVDGFLWYVFSSSVVELALVASEAASNLRSRLVGARRFGEPRVTTVYSSPRKVNVSGVSAGDDAAFGDDVTRCRCRRSISSSSNTSGAATSSVALTARPVWVVVVSHCVAAGTG